MDIERFDLPLPPPGLTFPQTPQLYVTIVIYVVVAGFAVHALYQWYRRHSPLAPLLLLGGALCYFNEPIVDVLGLCWHPRPGQWVALQTFGPAPLWGLGIYTIFYGGLAQLLLRQAERGITRRQFWIGVLAFFAVDLVCELPLIHLGLYQYYGAPPMDFMGLPQYWLFINTPGPLIDVAQLLRARRYFTGWRLLLIPLLPMTTDAMGSIAAGWPIFSALNTADASMGLKYAAAAITIALGLIIFDAVSRLICTETHEVAANRTQLAAIPENQPSRAQ